MHAANHWKSLKYEISHEKKIGPTRHPLEKILNEQNTRNVSLFENYLFCFIIDPER